MIKWLCRVFGGGSAPNNETKKSDIDLSAEGYSPKYAESRVREIRGKLIELREHSEVITRNGADKDGEFSALVEKTCTSVEKVLQNLKRDPNDFSRMGLHLESLDILKELVGKCAKFAATGVEAGELATQLSKGKEALSRTAKNFDELHRGVLQMDDKIEAEGLRKTLEDLSR